ncbi:MAG: MarR family transcriptional regulator [Archaeoglobaceae archaeon]|nr:MarR family transcriptional regulator [Archaeoglobaceae archaeon]MDW7990051.1 MarR family transcriptional regulator [Archaeoglobaceae archaeon]
MKAEDKIISQLQFAKEKGLLQSEITRRLNLSKSTVSEILSHLEEKRVIVREEISQKSYRVWLVKYYPRVVEGIVRIGILKASEYPKVVSAGEKVNAILRVYKNSIEATKDLVHGIVDIVASPFVTQAFFGVLMKNIKIFRVVAMNGSGVAISNGKGFGCSEFSTMERILRKYLKMKEIKEEIKFFDNPDEMISQISNLRGIAIWEPYFSMFEKVELFCDVIGDFVCCSLAVNENFLNKNRELFDEFLKYYDKSSPRDGVKGLSEILGFSEELIKKSLENYRFDFGIESLEKEAEELNFGRVQEILCFY